MKYSFRPVLRHFSFVGASVSVHAVGLDSSLARTDATNTNPMASSPRVAAERMMALIFMAVLRWLQFAFWFDCVVPRRFPVPPRNKLQSLFQLDPGGAKPLISRFKN